MTIKDKTCNRRMIEEASQEKGMIDSNKSYPGSIWARTLIDGTNTKPRAIDIQKMVAVKPDTANEISVPNK